MSFSFFKASKPKSPAELTKLAREALLTAEARQLQQNGNKGAGEAPGLPASQVTDKALEDAARSFLTMKMLVCGDGEQEASPESAALVVGEVCKDDFLEVCLRRFSLLEWEVKRDFVHLWTGMMRLQIGGRTPAVEFLEEHGELLEVLIRGYRQADVAMHAGQMLRDCVRHMALARYVLATPSFEYFFTYIELPNFDLSSDAFSTFSDLLTRHKPLVHQLLEEQYARFFGLYENLLRSSNYVTRRQSLKLLGEILLDKTHVTVMMRFIADVHHLKIIMTLLKDPSKNIQYEAFHVFKVFVANPNKVPNIVDVLAKNKQKLLSFLEDFHLDKEDEQFAEEKTLLCSEIERLSR